MVPIEQLSENNFFNVYFIALEIKRGLEITPNLKVYILESYIYSQNNPNYPCFSNTRFQTVDYLKNIGEIEEYHKVNRGRIGIGVVSQDKFFLFCSKLANIYNDRFTIQNTDKSKIDSLEEKRDEDDEDDEDCFSDDVEISTPYENTDFELFILKTILLLHKQRDDAGFLAKELSYNNNSFEEICRVINRLIEDKILYLSANTHPERVDEEGVEGIEAKTGFINWELVEKYNKNPKLMDGEKNLVCFDTWILDEIKLKGRIDIAIEEFMNDRIFTDYGLQIDKNELKIEIDKIKKSKGYDQKIYKNIIPEKITLPYSQQRKIVLDELLKNKEDIFIFRIKDLSNPDLDVFKTLLSLEKEGYIRIKGIGNGLSEGKDNWKFITKWTNKDDPFVKIEIMKRKEIADENLISKMSSVNTKIENGIGYFKFNKQGEKIKIGGVETRHFRLLQFLCSPINSAKTIDSVFDAIKKPKDKNDQMLTGYNIQQSYQRQLDLIKYAIKELQKNKKLQRKLKFSFDENQKTFRLKII